MAIPLKKFAKMVEKEEINRKSSEDTYYREMGKLIDQHPLGLPPSVSISAKRRGVSSR